MDCIPAQGFHPPEGQVGCNKMLGYHTIDHSKHPRMEYRQRASEEKGGVMQGGSLKLFCSEVAFLTGCYRPGDIVVYVGGRTVQQIPLLVKMFPGIHFDIFDSRPKETDQWMGVGERDCTFICRRFKDSDAVGYNSICKRVLFVSDTRSVSRDSTCRSSFSVTDDNIMDDLRQQESWVETMCPRLGASDCH